MKIAVLYPASRHAAWSAGEALAPTLRRMGHSVIAGGFPVELVNPNQMQFDKVKAGLPSLEELKQQELIIATGVEHTAPWIEAVYGIYEWKQLKARRCSWYHESFFREDYTIDFEALSALADEHFFPGVQDAEFFDQESFAQGRSHWLPLGVDTRVFSNDREITKVDVLSRVMTIGRIEKRWPIALVGLLYEKRVKFLEALSRLSCLFLIAGWEMAVGASYD